MGKGYVKSSNVLTALGVKMRLDKYLKVSRLIKRRTVANDACDAGRISVNGKVQKAGYDVKVGDIISMRVGDSEVKAQVMRVSDNVRKDEAQDMYKLI